MDSNEVTAEEWERWQALLPRPYRTPEREHPVDGRLLLDMLNDGEAAVQDKLSIVGSGDYRRPSLPEPAPESVPEPLEGLIAREEAAERLNLHQLAVRRMLRRLPTLERAVIRMRFGFGGELLEPGEIARQLGVCRKTVYNAEERALERLRGDEGAAALVQGSDQEARTGGGDDGCVAA